jgi:hypothetical protein
LALLFFQLGFLIIFVPTGVLQVPMLLSIWDDGFAISVPREVQTTKGEISKALAGFQRNATEQGIEIIKVAVGIILHYVKPTFVQKNYAEKSMFP